MRGLTPNWIIRIILNLAIFGLIQAPAYAGSRQHDDAQRFSSEQLAKFAKKVERFAANQSAQVFLIARLGTPKSELPPGIEFTHMGLAVYSSIQTNDGREIHGYAIHNLYQEMQNLSRSELVIDYPYDFFAGAAELKAGIIIPTPQLQQKLLAALGSGASEALHNPHYSIVSNPFNSQYQNCTEHLLDLIFSAIYSTQNVRQIKANEKAYFHPQRLELSPLARLFGPLLKEDVHLSDHSGVVETTTFTSIARFLAEQQLASAAYVMDEEREPKVFTIK